MGKRIISCIVIISLCASTIVGALRLSLRFANADAGDVMYLGDLESELIALAPQHQSDIETFFAVCETNLVSPSVWVSVIKKGSNYICTCWQITNQSYNNTLTGLTDTSGGQMFSGVLQRPYPNYSGFQDFYFSYICTLYFKYQDDIFYFRSNGGGSTYLTSNRSWPNSYSTAADFYAFPNYYDLNDPDTEVYCTKDISTFIQNYGFNFTANLFLGSSVPPEIEFECTTFWLGERQYFTVKDQYLMYSMIDYDNEGDVLRCFRANVWTDAEEYVSLYLPYEDTVLIEGGQNFVNGLDNVSAAGVYAWDITDKGLITIDEMYIYDYVDGSTGDIYRGYATNCPYDLTLSDPGTNGQPDSYTQMWSTFNEYVTNYNTTHVIPDDLSSWLFGISGSNIYPASVSVPLEVWNNNRSINDPASFANIHTWKWWLLENNLNINFELMDVVIVSESTTGEYSLIYYYDDRLSTPWKPVDNVSFDELVELFDVIIVVPDNDNCLIGNTWWQNALSAILTVLGWDNTISLLNSLAVSGTSSLGVQYVDERPDENAHVLDAFCIVTQRCLKKQEMLIFSDYLPKLYHLMSDYVSSEDNWKTSFLQWTASWFSAINTLNGSISSLVTAINNLDLSRIEDKLDKLIENTDEEESNFWYIPLWNFVKQFEPAAQDFVEGLKVYDDNWDSLPLLTPVPTIPLLPTISLGGG